MSGDEFDVVIVGGGPAGLSAALQLGRGRRRVLLCDSGPRRNAAATHIHGFVTRDGTPPAEFRSIGRAQLAPYASVQVRDEPVESVSGELDRFQVKLPSGAVSARRVVLCTGMIDELPPLPGYRELWGKALFQCPYCHGWEVRDRRFGYLVSAAALPGPEWALFLLGWTRDVVVFTDGHAEIPEDVRARLTQAGIAIETRRIARLIPRSGPDAESHPLEAVELADGARVPCDVIFARPPQRQPELVRALGLALDEQGYVRISPFQETSRPGIYAAGDLTTMLQAAIISAAAGATAAFALNHGLATGPAHT